MVNIFVNIPKVRSVLELKWNHITKPDVRSRADNAPVSGQGLGLTIWYAWETTPVGVSVPGETAPSCREAGEE